MTETTKCPKLYTENHFSMKASTQYTELQSMRVFS